MNNSNAIRISRVRRQNSEALQAINRRFALYRAGMNQTDIANRLQISKAAVSQTINNIKTSRPVAQEIAAITGLPLHELWPDGKYSNAEAQL